MRERLRVVTRNVGMVQLSAFGRRFEPVPLVEERLARLSASVRSADADILFFQELFHARHREMLIQALRDAYPYAAFHDDAGLLSLSNGLLCLSKFPFAYSTFVPFTARCLEESLFVSKGFQCIGVDVGARLIQVVHTHLTAGGFVSHPEHPRYDAIRCKQIRHMLHAMNLSECGLAIGDFNTGPQVSFRNYQQLRAILYDAYDLATERRGSLFTWDPRNPLNVTGPHKMCPPQRIDLAFCNPTFLKAYAVRSYQTLGEEDLCPLSDHWGVCVDFVRCLYSPLATYEFFYGLTGILFVDFFQMVTIPLQNLPFPLGFLRPFSRRRKHATSHKWSAIRFLGYYGIPGRLCVPSFP